GALERSFRARGADVARQLGLHRERFDRTATSGKRSVEARDPMATGQRKVRAVERAGDAPRVEIAAERDDACEAASIAGKQYFDVWRIQFDAQLAPRTDPALGGEPGSGRLHGDIGIDAAIGQRDPAATGERPACQTALRE